MVGQCAILQCCEDGSVRARIDSSQNNFPANIAEGDIYSISVGSNSSCFEVVHLSSPCTYPGTWGYNVPVSALFVGGNNYGSCDECYQNIPKVGNCTDVLEQVTPTPTPTISDTPTPTPPPTYTPTPTISYTPTSTPPNTPSVTPSGDPQFLWLSACTGGAVYQINYSSWQGATTGTVYISGDTVITTGCYTFINNGPASPTFDFDGSATEAISGCKDTLCGVTPTPTPSISETATPTPTFTPSVTPTHTPTYTPSVTPTHTPTYTPSVTPTHTPTYTPSVTPTEPNGLLQQLEDCCGGYFIFSGYTSGLTIGSTYSYNWDGVNGGCATAVEYSGLGPTYPYTVGNPVPIPSCDYGECPSCLDTWLLEDCCDSSNTIILDVNMPGPPNVYVFYDATSLGASVASGASESIRSWYDTNSSQLGDLYEGVVGMPNNNGENWLWWNSYPYLGSLTGGTLKNDTVVFEI